MNDLEWNTIKELKALCQQQGLDTTGSKQALVSRLKRHRAGDNPGKPASWYEREDDIKREITALLHDGRHSVRASAAKHLGNEGSKAKEAVPFLIMALDDPSPRVRRDAAFALGQIEDKSAISPLKKALRKRQEEDVINSIIYALNSLGVELVSLLNIRKEIDTEIISMSVPRFLEPDTPEQGKEASQVLNLPDDIGRKARAAPYRQGFEIILDYLEKILCELCTKLVDHQYQY